ncbi:hypothetical protein MASR2M78_33110 [Treponema sp.]
MRILRASMDFCEIAYEVAKPFVTPDISPSVLQDLVRDAFNFEAPLLGAADRLVLELFHGPTAAFKDFGARFMARAFAHLRRDADRDSAYWLPLLAIPEARWQTASLE